MADTAAMPLTSWRRAIRPPPSGPRTGTLARPSIRSSILDRAAVGAGDRRLHGLAGRHRLECRLHVVLSPLDVALPRRRPVVDGPGVDEHPGPVHDVHVRRVRGAVLLAHGA